MADYQILPDDFVLTAEEYALRGAPINHPVVDEMTLRKQEAEMWLANSLNQYHIDMECGICGDYAGSTSIEKDHPNLEAFVAMANAKSRCDRHWRRK